MLGSGGLAFLFLAGNLGLHAVTLAAGQSSRALLNVFFLPKAALDA